LGERAEKPAHAIAMRPPGALRIDGPHDLTVQRSIPAAYGPDGAVVESTMRLWGGEGERVDPLPERLTGIDVVDTVDEEVVWAGQLYSHYGHFLCEGVARLWPLLPGAPLADRRAVFVAPRRSPGFVHEWLGAFGVDILELPVHGAVRFTRMLVPEPAWRLNAWVAPEVVSMHRHVRDRLTIPDAPMREVLWASRSALDADRRAFDEGLLEVILARRVEIIEPESLTLVEQIALIENSQALAGIVGSAFHTLLLCARHPECVYVCPGTVASAFVAQDRLLAIESKFVNGLELFMEDDAARLPHGYRVKIPVVVRALAEAACPDLAESLALMDAEALAGTPEDRLPFGDRELAEAIWAALREPASVHARVELGRRFSAAGRSACAHEQAGAVTELNRRERKM
jgi:Glycosyltransferase 61